MKILAFFALVSLLGSGSAWAADECDSVLRFTSTRVAYAAQCSVVLEGAKTANLCLTLDYHRRMRDGKSLSKWFLRGMLDGKGFAQSWEGKKPGREIKKTLIEKNRDITVNEKKAYLFYGLLEGLSKNPGPAYYYEPKKIGELKFRFDRETKNLHISNSITEDVLGLHCEEREIP